MKTEKTYEQFVNNFKAKMSIFLHENKYFNENKIDYSAKEPYMGFTDYPLPNMVNLSEQEKEICFKYYNLPHEDCLKNNIFYELTKCYFKKTILSKYKHFLDRYIQENEK